MASHQYLVELVHLYETKPELFKTGSVASVTVYHSPRCGIWSGEGCDCNPDVIMDKPENKNS